MKILILGQGFIGSNLAYKLLREEHQVAIFTRRNHRNIQIQNCEYIYGDLASIDDFSSIFLNVDVVFHLIGTTLPNASNDDIFYDIHSNVLNSIKVVKLCSLNKIKKIIFASSGGTIYGFPQAVPIKEDHVTNPICSYGISKLMIEKYLYFFNYLTGLNYQILRISNPYGPYHQIMRQGVINVFLSKILNDETLEIWGDGTICRDYIYIEDLVEAMSLILHHETNEKILNIGTGKGQTLNDVLKVIKEVSGKRIEVIYKEARKIDIPINVLSNERALHCLGWRPKIDLYEGIEKTWHWIKKEKSQSLSK